MQRIPAGPLFHVRSSRNSRSAASKIAPGIGRATFHNAFVITQTDARIRITSRSGNERNGPKGPSALPVTPRAAAFT
jgi:hypothetical protein